MKKYVIRCANKELMNRIMSDIVSVYKTSSDCYKPDYRNKIITVNNADVFIVAYKNRTVRESSGELYEIDENILHELLMNNKGNDYLGDIITQYNSLFVV